MALLRLLAVFVGLAIGAGVEGCADDPLWRGNGAENAQNADASGWACEYISWAPGSHCHDAGSNYWRARNASGITSTCACLRTCGSCNEANCPSRNPTTATPTGSPTTPSPTESPTISPTTASPTVSPTVAPSPAPVLNTVGDCGRRHVACAGQLGSAYEGTGISCPAGAGDPNGRCVCVGAYHCRGTERRGTCAEPGDHCFERGITASPTAVPTVLPTSIPSAAPSSAPSSAPSTPSAIPSSVPTASSTTSFPTAVALSTGSDEHAGGGLFAAVIAMGVIIALLLVVVFALYRRIPPGADRATSSFVNPVYGAGAGAGREVTIDVPSSTVYLPVVVSGGQQSQQPVTYADVAPATKTIYGHGSEVFDDDLENML